MRRAKVTYGYTSSKMELEEKTSDHERARTELADNARKNFAKMQELQVKCEHKSLLHALMSWI